MTGVNKYFIEIDCPRTDDLQAMLSKRIPCMGQTYKGESILSVGWDMKRSYIITTEKKEEDLSTYYCTNGDVVEARRTGDMFLYVGGMYYNLSSKQKEMRGRKAIKRADGPLIKIANLSNSGDLFKEVIRDSK